MAQPVIDMFGREILTKDRICDQWLGFCSFPSYKTETVQDFTDRVLSTKPERITSDDYVQRLYEEIYNDPNPRSQI